MPTHHRCSDPSCFYGSHSHAARDEEIRRHIKNVGWTVIGVLGTPSIAYTVGLTERRWPELLFTLDVVGTKDTLTKAQRLLNAVARKLVEAGQKPRHGQVVTVADTDGGQWNCLLEARLDSTPLVQARNYYRRPVSALEVDFVE